MEEPIVEEVKENRNDSEQHSNEERKSRRSSLSGQKKTSIPLCNICVLNSDLLNRYKNHGLYRFVSIFMNQLRNIF